MKYTLTRRLNDATGIYTASGDGQRHGRLQLQHGQNRKPLRALLLENGWARKTGFFANLFPR